MAQSEDLGETTFANFCSQNLNEALKLCAEYHSNATSRLRQAACNLFGVEHLSVAITSTATADTKAKWLRDNAGFATKFFEWENKDIFLQIMQRGYFKKVVGEVERNPAAKAAWCVGWGGVCASVGACVGGTTPHQQPGCG